MEKRYSIPIRQTKQTLMILLVMLSLIFIVGFAGYFFYKPIALSPELASSNYRTEAIVSPIAGVMSSSSAVNNVLYVYPIGAQAPGAPAPTPTEYPAPFIVNNAPDVAVIYGSTAPSSDMTAAVDIAANLDLKCTTLCGVRVLKDSEISYATNNNLIVVGNPCDNTVARDLFGLTPSDLPSDLTQCYDYVRSQIGLSANVYLIQVSASPYNVNKIAMSAVGYYAADTVNAVNRIKAGGVSTVVGTKIIHPIMEQPPVAPTPAPTPSVISITSCPAILDQAGATYQIAQDLTTTETCLNITADNIIIDGNSKSISGDSIGGDYGIYMAGRKNIVINNFRNIMGFYYGMYLHSSSNSIITSNNAGANNYGIYLNSSSNNTINDLKIDSSKNDALTIEGSSKDNAFENLAITNTDPDHIDLNFAGASADFNETYITDALLEKKIAVKESILYFKRTGKGEIKFSEAINGTFAGGEDIKIEKNYAFINSSKLGINKSAQIIFYDTPGAGKTNLKIMRDSVYECNATTIPSCVNETALDAETVIFNVSSWSSYSIGGDAVPGAAPAPSAPVSSSTSGSIGGSGSGGGSGGGGSLTTISESQLQAGYTASVYVGGVIKFFINAEAHQLVILSAKDNNASIQIQSTPQRASFSAGEEKQFDITGDNVSDVSVKLIGASSNSADITIKKVVAAIPAPTPSAQPVEQPQQPPQQPSAQPAAKPIPTPQPTKPSALNKTSIMILALIILIAIAAFLIAFFMMKARKKKAGREISANAEKAKNFIFTARARGYSDGEIEDMFRKKGWSEEEIGKAFDYMGK